MVVKNGTVATKAWVKDDYILVVNPGQLELDQMVDFVEAMSTIENMGTNNSIEGFKAGITQIKELVAGFIRHKSGRPVQSDEAMWRAGKMTIAEMQNFFGGAMGSLEIPPRNADN